MNTDTSHIDRRTETGNYFFHAVEVMKRRENVKVAIRPIYFLSLLLGNKKGKGSGER